MLKYASSGAHIAGKPYTSSETFTWLTEHFRTSLSQCKPDIDLMFVSGVNHTFFHGTTYSPAEAALARLEVLCYGGYESDESASGVMRLLSFNTYPVARVFWQMGQPDNDFLVYLPVYDMWSGAGRTSADV